MTESTQPAGFPVHWDDPADAELGWNHDPGHYPNVITPLGYDLHTEPLLCGFGPGTTELTGAPMSVRTKLINYWVYGNWQSSGRAQAPRSQEEMNKLLSETPSRWRDDVLPESLRLIEHYAATDFDGLTDSELASQLEELREMRVRQGYLQTIVTGAWQMAMNRLVDTFQELTGAGALDALRLVQGYGNKSVEAGDALWRLSKVANSISFVREHILESELEPAAQFVACLRTEPQAMRFVDALDAFLDDYGWRTDLIGFASPTWREDPLIALQKLSHYLELGDYDPVHEQEKLARERDAAIEQTKDSLDDADWSRLQNALDLARDVVSMKEDRHYYHSQRLTTMPRRLVLAAGRRLVERGQLELERDIFYLHLTEACAALRGESSDAGALVSECKAEMERWSKVDPPQFVGAPPSRGVDSRSGAYLRRAFGVHGLTSDDPNVLVGNGCSSGVARGSARVILGLADAHRLRKGDVLVTKTTMPPWTPLFPVSCAVVTESGGVLSHPAVTAREYGIPAVLGVSNATGLLKDGQLVEVDGAKGTVRILS